MIRFRAWNKATKEVHEDDDIIAINFEEKQICVKTLFFDQLNHYDFDDVVLMQSTGFRDKNGKEIFEGDILNYKGKKALVTWHGSYASFIYRFVGESQKRNPEWDPLYLAYMKCEIVGNIWEDGELLD